MSKLTFKNIFIIFSIIGIISILSYILGLNICIFYNLTGVYCPSCGMTRAYVSLFRLDFKNAFIYNPMFIIVPLIILPFIIEYIFKLKNSSYKIKKSTQTLYFSLLLAILIISWIVRLYLYFPNEPMKYNENNILSQCYTAIKNSFR